MREDIWNGTGNPVPKEFTTEFFNQARPDMRALHIVGCFYFPSEGPNRSATFLAVAAPYPPRYDFDHGVEDFDDKQHRKEPADEDAYSFNTRG